MRGGNTPLPNSPQVEAMRKFMTDAEILSVLATDKRIDKGEKLFDLDLELEAGAKKARRADRTDTPKPSTRERKIDADKMEIMGVLNDAICDLADDVGEIVNEREFSFMYNERKFKITLSCPRS